MLSTEMRVVISSQAYLSIISETYSFLDIETGGIFIGTFKDDSWYILEMIDPGYKNTTRQHSYFEYDVDYVNHLANVKRRLYDIDVRLLGLWHRHPGSYDTFSSTDDATNIKFAELLPYGAISGIVNLDPDFRLSIYHVSMPLHYRKITDIRIGDSHIPNDLLKKKDWEEFWIKKKIVAEKKSNKYLKNLKSLVTKKDYTDVMQGSDNQEQAIKLLEMEQEGYLDKQTEYSYDVRLDGQSIEINMKLINEISHYPKYIKCQLSYENQRKYIYINDNKYEYEAGFIKNYIIDIVAISKNNTDKISSYLKVLDLDESYDNEILKKAYISKLKDYHPDTWSDENNDKITRNANIKTREVINAYEYLKKMIDLIS